MRTAVTCAAALAALLAAAAPARANQCETLYPLLARAEVPLGCPVVLYVGPDSAVDPALVTLTTPAAGGSGTTDVTGPYTSETVDVTVAILDDPCVEHWRDEREPFQRYSFAMHDVDVGYRIAVDGGNHWVTITEPGPCDPTLDHEPSCSPSGTCAPSGSGGDGELSTNQQVGCSASDSRTSAAFALTVLFAAVALLRRDRKPASRSAAAR